MCDLLKLFVVMLVINGAFITVQAADANLPITATLDKILSIEVKTASLSWDLDPANSPLIADIAKNDGVFVGTNVEDPWRWTSTARSSTMEPIN